MKEPVLAIIIGFIIGLVITFGIWTANKSLKQAQVQNATPTPTLVPANTTPGAPTPTPTPTTAPNPTGLIITTPDNEAIFNTTSTKLAGSTLAGSTIAITGGPNEQILQTDSTGQFSTEIDLESGYNLITVTSFDSKGTQLTKILTLTYTTTKI